MKKLLSIAVLCVGLFADTKADIEKIPFLQKNQISVTKVLDLGSLYIVKGEAQGQMADFFVSKDKKYIVFGRGFDSQGGNVDIPLDISPLKGKQAFTIGQGKNEYYVFTDPECPFCKQFESRIIKENLLKNNKFHFFLYPLTSIHKNAQDMSVFILSKKGDNARWQALLNVEKYKKVSDKNAEKELEANKELANKLGVNGTPTVIDSTGKIANWGLIK